MSIYSTKYITREEAIRLVAACRAKRDNPVSRLSDEELDRELHDYLYSESYDDILGGMNNYIIKEDPTDQQSE